MPLSITKLIQIGCWLATVILLFFGLYKPDLFKHRDIYLGLLECLVVASIGISEFSESRIKKYSVANALAFGYVKNFIEPIMKKQLEPTRDSANQPGITDIYIFMPATIKGMDATIYAELSAANLKSNRVTVPASTYNISERNTIQILNPSTKRSYYFDIPSTLLTLEDFLNHKFKSKSEEAKWRAEKKYLEIFQREVEYWITELKLGTHVKVVNSVRSLP